MAQRIGVSIPLQHRGVLVAEDQDRQWPDQYVLKPVSETTISLILGNAGPIAIPPAARVAS